jgi:hypothetical protein
MKTSPSAKIIEDVRLRFAQFAARKGPEAASSDNPTQTTQTGAFYAPWHLRAAVLSAVLVLMSGCMERPRARIIYEEPPPVVVTQAPPAALREQVPPPPGPEFVWIAGHWHWNRNRWVWNRGYYARPPRRGAVWIAPRFEAHEGGSVFIGGYWR